MGDTNELNNVHRPTVGGECAGRPCAGDHTIVDVIFEDPIKKTRWEDGLILFGQKATPYQIAQELSNTEGVLAHGVVTRADAVFVPCAAEGGEPLEIVVDKNR